MRSKSIISIAAFIIAFVFSTAFAGLFIAKSVAPSVQSPIISYDARQPTSCFKTQRGTYTADKIEVFISQDGSIGREHQQVNSRIQREGRPLLKSSFYTEYRNSVAEYVEAAENLDETTMPQEFQTAWRAHMQAWRDYAVFLETLKSSEARAEFSDLSASQAEAPFNAEIADTYEEVQRVGRSFGAKVP